MKPTALAMLFLLFVCGIFAQDAVSYQMPPADIAALLLAKPTPGVSINSKGTWLLLSGRNTYPSVEELARQELRIAGLRINPQNFAPSRLNFISSFTLEDIGTGKTYPVEGLPQPLQAGNVNWSPGEGKIAFAQYNAGSVDLYVINVATKRAARINKTPLNAVLGADIAWMDDHTLLYLATVKPASAAPPKPLMPKGPSVQENLGKTAPSATYEDLIKTPYDEQLFEFYATAQLVANKDGVETPLGKPAIYLQAEPSPDEKYILLQTVNKPFSYLVTAYNFASSVSIITSSGKVVKTLAVLPSAEGTPSGYDNTQDIPQNFDWRADEAAVITWSHPLDSGLIKKKVDYHDVVYSLAAPFTGDAKELFKTQMRYQGAEWGNDSLCFVFEGLRAKQTQRVDVFKPGTGAIDKLYERSTNDAYNNPGTPVTHANQYHRQVITVVDNGTNILMNNTTGSSPKGDLPFLSKYNLAAKKNEIIWRCSEEYYEFVGAVIDPVKLTALTRRETQTEVPNFYLKNLSSAGDAGKQLTTFTNPYPQLVGVTHQKVAYKRADSVNLTGDLYLPKGYDKDKDGPLPVLMWAYPREFNSGSDASQVRGSKNRFVTISWAGPIFWVTQGYAVLDNAEMPIVAGEGQKPNDTFVEQLELNAKAAIDKLAQMGVGDSNRVAVGGHSYGAFMTANLLAHTKLFKAGIARSGAYNRTLTPFGFQNEERTYWDDPNLYYNMSPFSFANQIKTPLLLIHGDADDNPGTFPINSERLFNAVKGFGGTVRLVYLPYEAHSYRGRENLLHMLWEMNQWLDTYVKHAK